jgi:inner membrane transporter RhtA
MDPVMLHRSSPRPVHPVVLAIAAMTCMQTGAAISVPLFAVLGVAGTTWLRLALSALVLLVVARPRGLGRDQLAASAALGVVMAANAVLFAASTERIPLGVAVAVEFCGPLGVAAVTGRRHGTGSLRWPALALVGVAVLTRPWRIGTIDGTTWAGLGLAAAAAVGWACYILLTAHVGRRTEGLDGLAVAFTVAALVLAPFGAGRAWDAVAAHDVSTLGRCALAAALVPLAAFGLEMAALRRMQPAVFGVWAALEPAFGTLAGLVVLGQQIAPAQLPGVALVVLAGMGSQAGASARRRSRAPSAGSAPASATTDDADAVLVPV